MDFGFVKFMHFVHSGDKTECRLFSTQKQHFKQCISEADSLFTKPFPFSSCVHSLTTFLKVACGQMCSSEQILVRGMWQQWRLPAADLTCKTFHIIGHAPFHPASASWMQRAQQRILKSLQWMEPLMDSAASWDHQLSRSLHSYMKLCSASDWTKPVMLGVIISSPHSTQKVNKLFRYNIKSPIFPGLERWLSG